MLKKRVLHVEKKTLNVTGMTCASCARAIEKSVSKVEGVSNASVNFATEKLIVEFDESKASIEKIKEAVERAGYGVLDDVEETIREVTIPISGMTCASCARAIEKSISKLSGIKDVSVNLASEKARVVYDSSQVRLSEIKNAIIKAGYTPLEIEKTSYEDLHQERKQKEINSLFKKVCHCKCICSSTFIDCYGTCGGSFAARDNSARKTSFEFCACTGNIGNSNCHCRI